ncbi:MAG: hypothetical protein AVDCRST_MAG08-1576, partial [uncultured Acetobacteraceae bacterium]
DHRRGETHRGGRGSGRAGLARRRGGRRRANGDGRGLGEADAEHGAAPGRRGAAWNRAGGPGATSDRPHRGTRPRRRFRGGGAAPDARPRLHAAPLRRQQHQRDRHLAEGPRAGLRGLPQGHRRDRLRRTPPIHHRQRVAVLVLHLPGARRRLGSRRPAARVLGLVRPAVGRRAADGHPAPRGAADHGRAAAV